MSQPFEQSPPNPATWQTHNQPTPRRRRPAWPWVTLAGAVVVIAAIIISVLALTGDGSDPAVEPISRAELMAEYAKIAPRDKTATPETIDAIAVGACDLLDRGMPTDRVISTTTDIYGAQATQVIRLFVSYKCPGHLKDFK